MDVGSHGKILKELGKILDNEKVSFYLTQKLVMDGCGVGSAHKIMEGGKAIAKVTHEA